MPSRPRAVIACSSRSRLHKDGGSGERTNRGVEEACGIAVMTVSLSL
jgi:hypothetical protein